MRLVFLCGLLVFSFVETEISATYQNTHNKDWLHHPRAPLLCATDFDGFEGTSIKGFILERVLTVTTPGSSFRTTDSLFSHEHTNSHCHFHEFAYSSQLQTARNYLEALSLKDRIFEKRSRRGSAFKVFNPIPLSKKCKKKMLTPQGIVQSIGLGEYLAKSYSNKLDFFSSLKREPWDLAHSVGDEVLYQSIYAVLYGLLGEKQFMYTRVGKLSQHFASGVTQGEDQEHLNYFIDKSFRDEHHLFKDHSSPTSDRWIIDSEFGRDISAKDVLSSVSRMDCDKLSRSGINLQEDLIESILSVSDAHNGYLMKNSIFQNYSKTVSEPLRKFIKTWILSSNDRKDLAFKLISVDDLSLLSLFTAFDQRNIDHIPPVSRLTIERFCFKDYKSSLIGTTNRSDAIFSNSSVNANSFKEEMQKEHLEGKNKQHSVTSDIRNFYFRVLYNGKVVTNDLQHCRSDPLISLGLCSLSSFVLTLKLKSQGWLGNMQRITDEF